MTTETLDNVTEGTVAETVPSLDDFAAPVSGAWPKGWYNAEVIEGYSTPKGKVFTSENVASKNGDSLNARFCFKVTNAAGEERTTQSQINYRDTDFTADRLAFIKQARQDNAGVKGAWADKDAQRSSLALASVGQLEKALGFTVRTSAGTIAPAKAVGTKLRVRFTINEDGYNDITGFDKASA